ncbi:MAG: hypothetical protein KAT52_10710, partial [Desulfobacterales bacterium]|nr:hypothetical protein [Desulfobacterales bacterium]
MKQNRFKSEHKILKKPGWRDYQARLKRSALRKTLSKKTIKYSSFLTLVLLIVYLIIGELGGTAFNHVQKNHNYASNEQISSKELIDKNDVQALLDNQVFVNLKDKSFDLVVD